MEENSACWRGFGGSRSATVFLALLQDLRGGGLLLAFLNPHQRSSPKTTCEVTSHCYILVLDLPGGIVERTIIYRETASEVRLFRGHKHFVAPYSLLLL